MIGSTAYIAGFDVESGEELNDVKACQWCSRMMQNAGIESVVYVLHPEDLLTGYLVKRFDNWVGHGRVEWARSLSDDAQRRLGKYLCDRCNRLYGVMKCPGGCPF